MSKIIELPGGGLPKARRQLARYLRDIADAIESDQAETEPHAFLMVLTGREQHEVLVGGYGMDRAGFYGAHQAVQTIIANSYRRRGGNICRRDQGGPYGGVLRHENVVQFAPLARKARAEGAGE